MAGASLSKSRARTQIRRRRWTAALQFLEVHRRQTNLANVRQRRFPQLLNDPLAGGMSCCVEMQNPSPMMFDYKEAVQHARISSLILGRPCGRERRRQNRRNPARCHETGCGGHRVETGSRDRRPPRSISRARGDINGPVGIWNSD